MTNKSSAPDAPLSERLMAIDHDQFPELTIEGMASPDFTEAGSRYTGWGWYVLPELKSVWGELTVESRLVAVLGAINRRERDNAAAW